MALIWHLIKVNYLAIDLTNNFFIRNKIAHKDTNGRVWTEIISLFLV